MSIPTLKDEKNNYYKDFLHNKHLSFVFNILEKPDNFYIEGVSGKTASI